MRILITGAGSGIGAGLAHALAADMHDVLVTDYDGEAAAVIAEAIRGDGYRAEGRALDVCDDAQLDELAEGTREAPIDVLINNAGLQHVKALEDFDPAQWRRLIEVMLTGAAMATRAVLPAMRERDFGRVINIGSVHSLVASPYKTAYVAAKHGLLGFAKSLALELADANITINTVCPGYVKTPLVENQIADQAKAHGISEEEVVNQVMLKHMPKKQFIEQDELDGAVRYLISPPARNITAQTIVLDGGWTAQ